MCDGLVDFQIEISQHILSHIEALEGELLRLVNFVGTRAEMNERKQGWGCSSTVSRKRGRLRRKLETGSIFLAEGRWSAIRRTQEGFVTGLRSPHRLRTACGVARMFPLSTALLLYAVIGYGCPTDFLLIDPSARSSGMGGASGAIMDGTCGLHANPASFPRPNSRGLALSSTPERARPAGRRGWGL